MPVCDSLLTDSTSIVALNVIPQTKSGRSSDGQFIYNTGLLPLRTKAFVERFASANYPSLAKALNKSENVEIIGESRTMWHHGLTTKSYGYDVIYDNCATDMRNADKKIFEAAFSILSHMSQPFYAQITTLSMHDPYNENNTDDITYNFKEITDSRDRNYWAASSHFDKWLGAFLNRLKNAGIYDNSVIVITGDHEASRIGLSESIDGTYIPLIILNAGIGMKHTGEIHQIDLFPSILDIMGIDKYIVPELSSDYKGFGRSLFSISSDDNLNLDEKWFLSERIIESRLFLNP